MNRQQIDSVLSAFCDLTFTILKMNRALDHVLDDLDTISRATYALVLSRILESLTIHRDLVVSPLVCELFDLSPSLRPDDGIFDPVTYLGRNDEFEELLSEDVETWLDDLMGLTKEG